MSRAKLREILGLHAKWLRGEPDGVRADLRDANLRGAGLSGASLSGANLIGADLHDANLIGADLHDADLSDADLSDADLRGASLSDAYLRGASLTGANLSRAGLGGADLSKCDLRGAGLRRADLTDATMPDGRKWEDYRADHYAGICDSPGVRAKADAAWGKHSWTDCPMHEALGIGGHHEAGDKAMLVSCWVALYDAGLLPAPEVTA